MPKSVCMRPKNLKSWSRVRKSLSTCLFKKDAMTNDPPKEKKILPEVAMPPTDTGMKTYQGSAPANNTEYTSRGGPIPRPHMEYDSGIPPEWYYHSRT